LTLVRRVDGEAAQKHGLESMDTPGPPRKTWTLWTSDWNTERRWSCCVWCATRRRARSLPVAGPSDRHDEPWPVLVHDQASRATPSAAATGSDRTWPGSAASASGMAGSLYRGAGC